MAESPSSTISTSTSSSVTSSASTNTSSGNPDNLGSFFGAAGSEPLLLVFLAVGLISAVCIAILGWRRMNYIRSGMGGGDQRTGRLGRGTIPGAVRVEDLPKLWDLRTEMPPDAWREKIEKEEFEAEGIGPEERVQTRKEEALSWRNIMPIAVSSIIQGDVQVTQVSQEHDPPLVPRSPRENLLMANLGNRYGLALPFRRRSNTGTIAYAERGRDTLATQSLTAHEERTKGKRVSVHDEEDTEAEGLPRHDAFQIVVAIAMPNPDKTEGEAAGEPGMYEYCIGVCRATVENEVAS